MQQKLFLRKIAPFIAGGLIATIIAIYVLKNVFNAPEELLSILKITLPISIILCAIIAGFKFRR
jgi:hypothetical protein